jgi:hypothetical protein
MVTAPAPRQEDCGVESRSGAWFYVFFIAPLFHFLSVLLNIYGAALKKKNVFAKTLIRF